jgi:hypothetical protein
MLHTGKDAGAFTFAAINRASGDGIVILTNSDNRWRVILPILKRTVSDPMRIPTIARRHSNLMPRSVPI